MRTASGPERSKPTLESLWKLTHLAGSHSSSLGVGIPIPPIAMAITSSPSLGVRFDRLEGVLVSAGLNCDCDDSVAAPLPTFLTNCSTNASTLTMRSPINWPRSAGRGASSGYS